ncbi:isoamylase early set domain-containing protein [Larkinella insperata]|uniref:Isoamylase early set domain-containing protein n=1 Tax=Larkinella insperata TaxID=332158 RepID=A0ABW3Q7S7_9BACT|nr:isoamylase early set domain-containing protein [Larkinella insperata]
MALAKQYVKSKPTICKVTFTLPADAVNGAKEVALVGDFNGWDASATPLKKQKDGSYKTTVELPVGQETQFRYLIDGDQWLNDPEADKFIGSGVSSDDNSVVAL